VTHRDVGFERAVKDVDVTRYADLFTYLRTEGSWFGHLVDIGSGETSLFVGAVALVLAALSVLWLRPPVSRSRTERLLAAAVLAGLALVVLAAAAGPRLRLGQSAFSATGAAVLLVSLARQLREGWQRWQAGVTDRRLSERDWVSVLLVVGAFAFFLSLGPVVHVANHPRGSGFYAWLYPYLFPLHVIRTTSRFGLLAAFATAILAGFGVTWLVTHVPRRVARPVTVGAVVLLLVEYARFPLSLAMVPVVPRPIDTLLRADTNDVAVPRVADVPDDGRRRDAAVGLSRSSRGQRVGRLRARLHAQAVQVAHTAGAAVSGARGPDRPPANLSTPLPRRPRRRARE
jgi:hypothetical protein